MATWQQRNQNVQKLSQDLCIILPISKSHFSSSCFLFTFKIWIFLLMQLRCFLILCDVQFFFNRFSAFSSQNRTFWSASKVNFKLIFWDFVSITQMLKPFKALLALLTYYHFFAKNFKVFLLTSIKILLFDKITL